jgi:hypothetical protein
MSDEAAAVANNEFDFLFAGRVFKLKKANLKQVIEFQKRLIDITKDNAGIGLDVLAIAPALLIVLKNIDPTITEDYILENTPGDIDVMGTLQTLGFMNQQKKTL